MFKRQKIFRTGKRKIKNQKRVRNKNVLENGSNKKQSNKIKRTKRIRKEINANIIFKRVNETETRSDTSGIIYMGGVGLWI